MKIIRYISLFLWLTYEMSAVSFSVYNINADNYPDMYAEFFLLDNDNNPYENIFPSDFKIFENGIENELLDFQCNYAFEQNSISAILSIDISNSMEGERLQFAKNAAREFIDLVDFQSNEVALQTFNKNNYLNQDFTNQKFRLFNALDGISSIGGTDFDATFLKVPAGIFQIADNAEYQPVAIILTDGIADGDSETILSELQQRNLKIYSVTLSTDTPELLKKASELSGGKSFANINTEEQLIAVYKIILRLSQGNRSCSIKWKAEGCESIREVKANIEHLNISETLYYKAPLEEFAGFHYINNNYLEFGIVEPGSNPIKNIQIRADNSDITIYDVIGDNEYFKVVNFTEGMVVKAGEEVSLNIVYNPEDTDYQTAEFKIISDICYGEFFYVSGGDRFNIGDKKLEILQPNGGENYFAGDDALIKWRGLIPSDSIELEFSSDNGISWSIIDEKATSLEYLWKGLPENNGDEYLVKAIQFSDQLDDSQVKIYNGFNGRIDGIISHKDSTTFIYDSMGSIYSLNPDDDRKILLFNNIAGLSCFDISKVEDYIAYSDSSNEVKVYRYSTGKLIGKLVAPENDMRKISFSPEGNLLAGISSTGNLFIWRLSDTRLVHEIEADPQNISDFLWSVEGDQIITAGESGSLKIWNPYNKQLINELINFGNEIVDISLSSNNSILALLKKGGSIEIWARSGESSFVRVDFFQSATKNSRKIEFSPNIDFLAEAGDDSTVYFRSTSDLVNIDKSFSLIDSDISSISWSTDSQTISAGTRNKKVYNIPVYMLPLRNFKLQEDVSDETFSIITFSHELIFLNFPDVKIYNYKDSLVKDFVINSYDIPIMIDSIYIENNDGSFKILNQTKNIVIEPGSSLDIEVRFSPKEINFYEKDLIVSAYNKEFRNKLFGKGIEPELILKTNILDFLKLNIGKSRDSLAAIIENVSPRAIIIDSMKLVGPDIEQFGFVDQSPFILDSGETKEINVSFAPTETGRTSGSIGFFFESPFSPVIADLFGEGTAPQLNIQEEINISIQCEEEHEFELKIMNEGDGDLEILDLQISNKNDFEIITDLTDLVIAPEDVEEIRFLLKNYELGTYSTDINIVTNEHSNGNNIFRTKINARKDSIGFSFDNSFVEFVNIKKNNVYYDTILVENTGNITLRLNSTSENQYFELESIIPEEIPPQSEAEVILRFNGSDEDGIFSESIVFDAGCNAKFEVFLYAYIGVNLSELQVIKMPEFDKLNCVNEKDTSLMVIKNIGKSPLIVFDYELESEYFNLLDDLSEVILLTDEEHFVRVEFTASNITFYEETISLQTNAINALNNKYTVNLLAEKFSSEFEISIEEHYFIDVLENFKDSVQVNIKNTGDYEQILSIKSNNNYFVSDISQIKITPDNDQYFWIYFNGGNGDTLYSGTIEIINNCGETKIIDLNAFVKDYSHVGFKLNENEASKGDTVKYFLSLYSPENIDIPNIKKYKASICFDHSLLFPVNETPGGVINGEMRCIELNNLEYNGDNLLEELEFLVTIGDTTETQLFIISPLAIDTSDINIETQSGYFKLLINDTILIDDTGVIQLQQNKPNPSYLSTIIEFNAIEKGNHKLIVIDGLGREIATIFNQYITPGNYSVEFNTSKYSQGFYLYQLITPTMKLHKKMLILE